MGLQNHSSNLTALNLFPDGQHASLHWAFTVAMVLMKYVLPVIIITGLLGNILSILVFLTRDLRRLSSTVYVLAVLTSDTGILIGLLFVWLEVLGIRLNHEEGACQFLVFLTYACSFLSVWYTVCITIENFIAICHPTKVKVFCTQGRALAVVTLLACGSLPLYILSAAATEVRVDPLTGRSTCLRKREAFTRVMNALTIFDSVVTLLVPLVCVTVMLMAIVLSIVNTYRWRRSSPGSQKRRAELMRIPQVRVAKMLFALSLAFVIMNSPSHVSRLYYMLSRAGSLAGFQDEPVTGLEGEKDGAAVVVSPADAGVRNGVVGVDGAGPSRQQPTDNDTIVSHEEGVVQLILLYGSYLYYAVKFILFLTFSKNFRRSIRESCTDSVVKGCQNRATAPTAL